MPKKTFPIKFSIALLWACLALSCKKGGTPDVNTQFSLLPPEQTGIDFSNELNFSNDFNVYRYRNFYNGGGVALGDVNNDGLLDVYLTANQQPNRLYLNKGNLRFEDITEQSGTGGSKPWSTGVAMVDINADGHLDIYVCNSGDLNGTNKQNELFINNGDNTFTEKAAEYHLDDKGFSTHASFFDYDRDGDLDAYILNNSYQAIGSFDLRRNERPKRDLLGGDKLLRNDGGTFVDVSEAAGIYGSVVGFGLGVTVGDVNRDGWPDIYVSNDFFERDYLYINQQDGTFSETLEAQISSTSGASMGADMADVNNDGLNDIFVTDMLPSDYGRLKTVTTFEDWNRYQLKVNNGYHHQFTRNTFQLNNGNQTFSEVGRLSGIEASDWSWGALLFDMDNDGLKDLFIANGIYRDITNQDYLQYISNEEVLKSIAVNNQVDFAKLIEIIPSNKVANHAYKNNGELHFKLFKDSGLLTESFSNGAAYGDLDNDGDLDLVVNNVNMNAFIYRNNTSTIQSSYLKFILKGEADNTNAIGAKVTILPGNQTMENQPAKGFQSSMDMRPNFAVPSDSKSTVQVRWPSGKMTVLDSISPGQILTLYEKEAKVSESETQDPKDTQLFYPIKSPIDFTHQENRFVDFDRNRLLYQMYSTQGPKMAWGDVNGDAIADVFLGSARGSAPELYLSKGKRHVKAEMPAFDLDKQSEDTESLFFDADNDGDLDLYVCSGGIEYSPYSVDLLDRLYLNDGNGHFTESNQKLPLQGSYHSTSSVTSSDIDGDGDQDLFVGERLVPLNYGKACSGFILENDGHGRFTENSAKMAPELAHLGMITNALFNDFDGDGDADLVVIGEFMGVEFFQNNGGRLDRMAENPLVQLKGWWNTVHAADFNNDGLMDLALGNHGENSRFKASDDRPITLYTKDFDNNGFEDPILAFRAHDGKDYPYALRHNLIDQIKALKKLFPNYESFKNAGITDIFGKENLKNAQKLEVTILSSVILLNTGNFGFEVVKMPLAAQFSPIYAIESGDFDQDGDLDLLLGGNLFNVKPEIGRHDASYGTYLENMGDGNFRAVPGSKGFVVKGEIRDIKQHDGRIFVARNNQGLLTFKQKEP